MGLVKHADAWIEELQRCKGIKTLRAFIITGNKTFYRECHRNELFNPSWKICTETFPQLNSDQYIESRGFKLIESQRLS